MWFTVPVAAACTPVWWPRPRVGLSASRLKSGFVPGRLLAPLHEPRFLPVLAFLVLFCSLGSNMLGNYATAKLSVVRYTTLNSVSVLFSLFSGVVLLKEPLTPVSFVGAVLTLIGVVGIGHAKSAHIKKAGPAQQAGNIDNS